MARLGVDVLGTSDLSLLIGRPRAADAYPIPSRLEAVGRVVAETVGEAHPDREFMRPGSPRAERFDLVVAPDLIAHFEDPHVGFAQLFSRLDGNGLLICSTQIYDGGDLDRQRYVFGPGHASYYSPKALRRIAAAHDLRVNLRMPVIAAKKRSRRRYVFFAGSARVMASVSQYVDEHRSGPTDGRAINRRRDAHREAGPGSTRPSALV